MQTDINTTLPMQTDINTRTIEEKFVNEGRVLYLQDLMVPMLTLDCT